MRELAAQLPLLPERRSMSRFGGAHVREAVRPQMCDGLTAPPSSAERTPDVDRPTSR